MTDPQGVSGASSRLTKLRQRHKALLSSSNKKIAQSRSRLDNYSDAFQGSGRKFFFEEKTASTISDDDLSADSLTPKGSPPNVAPAMVAPAPGDEKLKEENEKLKEQLKDIQAEREKLRKNLSQVAIQVQNASKAILSTKLHEANARYSSLEIELQEAQETLTAKESSTTEVLSQMQKLRKENAKLASQVRLSQHAMTGTKNSQIKDLQERILHLEELNHDLMIEKVKFSTTVGVKEEDRSDDEQEEEQVESAVARVRQSTMTMVQTQLAVSSAQLTAAEMELSEKSNELEELEKQFDRAQAENNMLRDNAGIARDATLHVEALKSKVADLEEDNKVLIKEKMSMSQRNLGLGIVPEDKPEKEENQNQAMIRSSNLSMMKTKLAVSSAQLTSVEMELSEKEQELVELQISYDEMKTELESAQNGKKKMEKKVKKQADQIHELENRKPTRGMETHPMKSVPTNIEVGVGASEIGGTFDFGALPTEGEEASIKVVNIGGDDQTLRSAFTEGDTSTMAQTYAVTIVQTKLADSHAKYADMEMKYNELRGAMDDAMVEIGSKQVAAASTKADLAATRDRNTELATEMEQLKAQIALLEDKQIKGMKRRMKRAKQAEEEGENDDDDEEDEVITIHDHRSQLAIVRTKFNESNVKAMMLEREMDEVADMLESALLDAEAKRETISTLNKEITEVRKENVDLYTQVQEHEAMNDIFEGARVQELETQIMGLEMINQQLMLKGLELDDDAASAASSSSSSSLSSDSS